MLARILVKMETKATSSQQRNVSLSSNNRHKIDADEIEDSVTNANKTQFYGSPNDDEETVTTNISGIHNGKVVNLSDLKGKVVFLNFWTTWCPPCRAEMPSINSLYQKTKVTQQDLNSNDLWLLTEGHCFRDQSLLICKNRKKTSDTKKNIKFESGSLETLRRMMDQENGFTLLPYLATLDLQNKKQLKEFSAPVPTREVSLVHSAHFKRTAVIDAFTEVIKKSLPKNISLTSNKNTQVIDLPLGNAK